jgi:phosphatidylethanolamine/phosphatidyl-N-methylethanolamine N-methyltransferase
MSTQSAADWPIFMRHWLRHPIGIGALLPSGARVARAMARQVQLDRPGKVLELGAGTGGLSRGLIEAGCPADRLILLESEPELAAYLGNHVAGPRVLLGDALRIDAILDDMGVTELATVVSSLPIKWFPPVDQRAVVMPCLKRLGPGGSFIQLTNGIVSPIRFRAMGINGERVDDIWRHFLPVQLWRYWLY